MLQENYENQESEFIIWNCNYVCMDHTATVSMACGSNESGSNARHATNSSNSNSNEDKTELIKIMII